MTEKQFYEKFSLPPYVGGGEALELYPCANDNYLLRLDGVSAEDASEYLKVLGEARYSLCSAEEIDGNRFYRFNSEGYSLYLSYMPRISVLRMVCGEMENASPRREKSRDFKVTPTVSQMQLKLGMCYCITLCDGTFLVIDGGLSDAEDEDRLYRFLCDNNGGEGKPLIRGWFMSHTHPDHTRLAESFMNTYSEQVELLEAIYNFPDYDKITVHRESAEGNAKNAKTFADTVSRCYPEAVHTRCHTGEVIRFPGVDVITLMTHEDVYPIPINSSNHTSSVWRFDFDGGSSFMCLADMSGETCELMVRSYSAEFLKADIMQPVHHGLLGGNLELYQAIDPDICLWPSPKERFEGTWIDPRRVAVGKPTVQFCIGEGGCDYNVWLRNDEIKKRKHFHAGVTTTIPV